MSLFEYTNTDIYSSITLNIMTFTQLSTMTLLNIEKGLQNSFNTKYHGKYVFTKHKTIIGNDFYDNIISIQWLRDDLDNDKKYLFDEVYKLYSIFHRWCTENIKIEHSVCVLHQD